MEPVEAATEVVEPADDPTRNFSMFSISDDMLEFLVSANGGPVTDTGGATPVALAVIGRISWMSMTPSRISLRTSSLPTSNIGFVVAAEEDWALVAVTDVAEVVVADADDGADVEVELDAVVVEPSPDIGGLGCKTVAVAEVAEVAGFTIPAALSAG